MGSLSFDISEKDLKLPFDNCVEDGNILSLGDWKLWALFGNGQWILFDLEGEGKILNRGLITKEDINKHSHILQYPVTFDGKTIIFASAPDAKVMELDPFSGSFVDGWDVPYPTLSAIPQQDRDKIANYLEPINQTICLGLDETQTFVIQERRGNDLLVTAARKGQSQHLMAVLQSESKNYIMGKVNNRNKIIMLHDTPEKKVVFSIWDLSDANAGFVNYSIDCDITGAFLGVSGWGDNEIVIVGNVDGSETPTLHFVNTQERKVTKQESLYADKKVEQIANEVIHFDQKKKKVLFIENGPPDLISLFDIEKNRPDCHIKQKQVKRTEDGRDEYDNYDVVTSTDGKFIVEYFSPYDYKKDVSDDREGVLKVRVLRVIKRQKVLLHLMKNHVTKKGQQIDLINYYGNPYVAAQVLEMLGEKKK